MRRKKETYRLAEFEKVSGIKFMNTEGENEHGIFPYLTVRYKRRRGKVLKELYFKVTHPILKRAILLHPNCPRELRIAEEL